MFRYSLVGWLTLVLFVQVYCLGKDKKRQYSSTVENRGVPSLPPHIKYIILLCNVLVHSPVDSRVSQKNILKPRKDIYTAYLKIGPEFSEIFSFRQ